MILQEKAKEIRKTLVGAYGFQDACAALEQLLEAIAEDKQESIPSECCTCKYEDSDNYDEPCYSCKNNHEDNYEQKEGKDIVDQVSEHTARDMIHVLYSDQECSAEFYNHALSETIKAWKRSGYIKQETSDTITSEDKI